LIGSSEALFQTTFSADWFDIRKRSTNRYDFSGTALFQTTVSADWFDIESDWRIDVNIFAIDVDIAIDIAIDIALAVGLLLVVWSVRAQRCFKQLSRLIDLILESDRRIDMTSRGQRCFKRLSRLIDLILEVIDESV
jgi:hypothetical protein